MRRIVGVAVFTGLALAVTGCSTNEPVVHPEPTETNDYGVVMARCLNDKGWDVTARDDGGFQASGIPTEQADQYNNDIEACHAEHGYSDDAGYTPERANTFFDLSLENAACLEEELGYEISDPPSRQAFVEALVNGEPPPWFPHLEALAQGGRTSDEIEAVCPQPGNIMDSR